ncbi:MAG: hypothetical protein ACYC8W_09175 [Candidatus Tyrphobacter sp.]
MRRRAFLNAFGFAVLLAALVGCKGGALGPTPNTMAGSHAAMQPQSISSATFAPQGGLDCNGWSPIQKTFRHMTCADPTFGHRRAYDNGWYVGHDEPAVGFYSSSPHSGNNMQWEFRLNSENAMPATQSFENFITFWFSLAICDPSSYPQNPCTPDSDHNAGGLNPRAAGSAILELQFYPPGAPPFITNVSCNATQWCAALNIDSYECTFGFSYCNGNCFEPVNFAFIQTDGVPPGPPGPGTQTTATYTNNGATLYMNQNDLIRVTIKDTREGLLTKIEDLTTGQSGFMVASAANGFQHTSIGSCSTTPFSFHPEFATAKPTNIVPWAALKANVNLAMEIGHFEIPDGDGDDYSCFNDGSLTGCIGADTDFDGQSYQPDWPDGTADTATPLQFTSVLGTGGLGPASGVGSAYTTRYPTVEFETDVGNAESSCDVVTGTGCVVPPGGAAFYPYYTVSTPGHRCTLNVGQSIAGLTVEDFGEDAEYGSPDVAWYGGTLAGGYRLNPCGG